MTEFTSGELKLMFQRIEEKLDELNRNMSSQHARYDLEIKEIKKDVEDLRSFQTKAMTVWGISVTAIGFLLNKFL